MIDITNVVYIKEEENISVGSLTSDILIVHTPAKNVKCEFSAPLKSRPNEEFKFRHSLSNKTYKCLAFINDNYSVKQIFYYCRRDTNDQGLQSFILPAKLSLPSIHLMVVVLTSINWVKMAVSFFKSL